MSRRSLPLVLALVLPGLLTSCEDSARVQAAKAARDAACAGPALRSPEALEKALTDGYTIDRNYDCISRESFEQVQRANAALQAAKLEREAGERRAEAERQARERTAPAATAAPATLAEARSGFYTQVSGPAGKPDPLPNPPPDAFVRSDYRSKDLTLAAYITPDPKDRQERPAIIWLTGGDSNSLNDFWTQGPASNDQSAIAFRKAGLVMMFPTLRGGKTNPGAREYFYSEVDDVLAAAEHLARQPHVDPAHIYLGGHSTGGTLALLVAEASPRFRGVFAFGPVTEVDRYPRSLIPVDLQKLSPQETRLRSPVHWVSGIASQTWVIEGSESPNADDAQRLCRGRPNPQLHCIVAKDQTHFSVLDTATRVIAARIAVAGSGGAIELTPDSFDRR